MAFTDADIQLAATIFHNAAWIIFYAFVGLGSGFVIGILIANRIWGRGQPTLVQIHRENAAAAREHNELFSPTHPRWKKT